MVSLWHLVLQCQGPFLLSTSLLPTLSYPFPPPPMDMPVLHWFLPLIFCNGHFCCSSRTHSSQIQNPSSMPPLYGHSFTWAPHSSPLSCRCHSFFSFLQVSFLFFRYNTVFVPKSSYILSLLFPSQCCCFYQCLLFLFYFPYLHPSDTSLLALLCYPYLLNTLFCHTCMIFFIFHTLYIQLCYWGHFNNLLTD